VLVVTRGPEKRLANLTEAVEDRLTVNELVLLKGRVWSVPLLRERFAS